MCKSAWKSSWKLPRSGGIVLRYRDFDGKINGIYINGNKMGKSVVNMEKPWKNYTSNVGKNH